MSENKNQILIADDSRVIRRAAVKILQNDYEVIEAEDGRIAWDELQRNPNISVLFSDLGMPNMDGFELLENVRKSDDPALAKMPVIIITGAEESDGAKEKVLGMGATDFITKPFDSHALKSRASAHINYRNEVQSLEKQTVHDRLTGLLNEAAFLEQAEKSLAYARRHGAELCLVQMDIHRFSEIFIKHGRGVAEQILAKVAAFIKEGMRTEDMAARLGVSSFGMVLTCSGNEGSEVVIQRICENVARLKLKMGEEVFRIQLNAGTSIPGMEDADLPTLIERAQGALKQAVENGDGRIVHYGQAATAAPAAEKAVAQPIDVNLEQLLEQLDGSSPEQLAAGMRKLLPLMAKADEVLRLGLGKVVPHLKNKLQ